MKTTLVTKDSFNVNVAKPRLRVSVSGGRTSARMAQLIKEHLSSTHELLFLFANTSYEDPRTLRFLNDVDKNFDLGLVWLEAVVHQGKKSSTHKVVNYETACTKGEVFEAVVAKYGLPNQTFKLCTRELKTNVMSSYAKSIGWHPSSYQTAIGIRKDETRRVADSAEAQRIVYPLVDWWPTDKLDVLDHFEQFTWDLDIKEYEGNCLGCFKKSDKKLHTLYRERPDVFDLPIRLGDLYAKVGPNNVPGPRKMYRGYQSATELVTKYNSLDFDASKLLDRVETGCSESCELYETVEIKL